MIYIDLDDVVAETGLSLSAFASEYLGRSFTIEDMFEYDLRKSFSLDEDSYRDFMREFHTHKLGEIGIVQGAAETIISWSNSGWDPVIVTGRPTYCRKETQQWLDDHGIGFLHVINVDKYGTLFYENQDPLIMPFRRLAQMNVRFAIDDAPNAADMISEMRLCPTALFNKPWNKRYTPPEGAQVKRISCWEEAAELAQRIMLQAPGKSAAQ